jgi:Rrf2 family iron-sulfur cluster assembly transcriptional regulator
MRFSQRVHYAVSGIFDLAYHGHGGPVQVRVIGERQRIPARYLEQIFQRLRRARLVHGRRGPGGGYLLSRPASEISVLDVVEAIEGEIGQLMRPRPASRVEQEPLGQPDFLWRELGPRFAQVLSDYTFEDLCRQAARQGLPREGDVVVDYQI